MTISKRTGCGPAVKAACVDGVKGSASDNFFVTDPDGLRVQISAFDWRG